MKRTLRRRPGFLPALLAIAALVFSACNWDTKGSEQGAPALMGGAMQGVPLSLTGTTSTLAGIPLIGSQDGTGTDAQFNHPSGITSDGTNLYVADPGNNTIRKVVIATGEVTTVAGTTGRIDDTVNSGTNAWWGNPMAITTDGTNLYVAASDNHAILKVAIATEEVTILAGSPGASGSADGTGTAARFRYPRGITTDGTSVYVADTLNNTIRRVDIATGTVTTLAGTAETSGSANGIGAAARFKNPLGISTDGINVYVAEQFSYTIRKIVIATGEVTTLAGTAGVYGYMDGTGSAAQFSEIFGLATDGTNIYAADTRNHTIRKVVVATGEVTTLAGSPRSLGFVDATGATARFDYPVGIVMAGPGLYVADTENHLIREVAISTAEVTTLAGAADSPGSTDGAGSAARFRGPRGITTDGSNFYVADTGNNTIRKVVIADDEVTTLAGMPGVSGTADNTGAAARFNSPRGVTTDGTNLYVTDTGNNTIRKVVIATGEVTTLAGTAGTWGHVDGAGPAAQFRGPAGITTDGTNLYVADSWNYAVRKVVIATGEVTTLIGPTGWPGTAGGTGPRESFVTPGGITTDGTNLYVGDAFWNLTICKVVIATGEVMTLAGTAGAAGSADGTGAAARFGEVYAITTDGTNLYAVDARNATIRKITIATGEVTTLAGSGGQNGSTDGTGPVAKFSGPSGVTTDGARLYVTDTENNTIRRID